MEPQGLIPPQNDAAPVQSGEVTPEPQEQGLIPQQPPSQSTPAMGRPIATPEPERDYEANPLNEEDKDNLDKFRITATKLIHSPQTSPKILARIKGQQDPHTEVADAAYGVITRIIQQGKKEKRPYDKAVLLAGGVDVVSQILELASAAHKLPAEPNEQDAKIIAGKVVQRYYKERMATGEISKEQAARDAQIAAAAQAKAQGDDVSETAQRVNATQEMKGAAVNAPKKGLSDPNGLQAPQEQNPFNPTATMKETLATGQGGLLNGIR